MCKRVFILSNQDFSLSIIFSKLLKEQNIKIVGIGFTKTITKKKGKLFGAFELLKKMDKRYWLFLVISNMVFEIIDKLPFVNISLRKKAKKMNIPIYYSSDFNSLEFRKILLESDVDILLIRVNQILKKDVFNIPKEGTYGIHSSILPSYKGIAGEFHALRNKESIIGCSIFKVVEKLDEGPVLAIKSFKVNTNCLLEIILKNNFNASNLLIEFLNSNKRKEINSKVISSYYSWPKTEEVNQFKKLSFKFFCINALKKLILLNDV